MTDDPRDRTAAADADQAPPQPLPPGPPPGPRDPGDAWAYGPDGQKFWGAFGAAGLLVADSHGDTDRVLLQHRVEWSHHGGTWGIPGGARHQHEDAVTGALRESAEEAGVPSGSLRLRHTSVVDLGFWSYTTVVARTLRPFDAVVGDRASLSLDWVADDDVDDLPLHPGFGSSWPGLRATFDVTPHIVVDAANVVGSTPNGWWKDRAGAAGRLLDALDGPDGLAERGVPGAAFGLPHDTWWPDVTVVLEGQARRARGGTDAAAPRAVGRFQGVVGAVTVDRAEGAGDDGIVLAARRAVAAGATPVVVVTADRELRARVEAEGARAEGPSWLHALLER